jgi:hypothetical protein
MGRADKGRRFHSALAKAVITVDGGRGLGNKLSASIRSLFPHQH